MNDIPLLMNLGGTTVEVGVQAPAYHPEVGQYWPADSITPIAPATRVPHQKETHQLMSTMTMERPALVAPAAAANKTAYAAVINTDRKAGIGGFLKRVPRRFRAWLQGVQKTFRTSAIGSAIGRGFSRLKGALASIYRRVGGPLFIVGVVGSLLTCKQGRQILRKVVTTTARVVTAPVRFLGRLAAKVLNRFGWGRKVVTQVQEAYTQATAFAAVKFEAAMTWLDKREGSFVMSVLRRAFQDVVAGCLIGGKSGKGRIQGFVPQRFQQAALLAHWILMPEVGTDNPRPSHGRRLWKLVRELVSEIRGGSRTADEASEFLAKGSVEAGIAYTPEGLSYPVEVITDGDGDRWVKIDGMLYPAEDLPNELSLEPQAVVKQLAEAKSLTQHLEAQVAATTATAPPANRAEKRAAAKAHGPVKK